MDITSIPMARGFVYLAAVVDWFSRWRLSITMDVDFCLEAVEEALAQYGRPQPSPGCCWRTRLLSAWMAAALGAGERFCRAPFGGR
jgi:transposase InsO family protein